MTRPLGSAPTPQHEAPSQSYCGYPVLIRVPDLAWQPAPPAPVAPASSHCEPSLLGDDPPEAEAPASLLNTPQPPAYSPLLSEATGPTGAASPAPSSPHSTADLRAQRRQSIQQGQWLNRLYLGGMAVSLLVASYWVLNSGGSADSATEEVPQDMFAATGELDEAPAWSGLEPSISSTTSVTVEPLDNPIPQMASKPELASTPSESRQADRRAEMTTVVPPYGNDFSYSPSDYTNPAWSEAPAPSRTANTHVAEMDQDDYIPSFGPSSADYAEQEPIRTARTSSIPMGNNAPSFSADASDNPASEPQQSYGYPLADESSDTGKHWALQEGKLIQKGQSDRSASQTADAQLPQIYNGPAAYDRDMPVIQTPQSSQMATTRQGEYEQGGFGFGPYSGGEPAQGNPAYGAESMSSHDEFPRSASRAGLLGVQPFESETR